MKIETLTIQGFRGINKKISISLHENLTLIFGKNSHGKTSISEALEWLLYGSTSKIDTALSKQEYNGSYKNCHYESSEPPYVEVVFRNNEGNEIVCRGELIQHSSIQKYLNDTPVDQWPWENDSILNPRPFIIQHALKSLLLAKPIDRYIGFTRLIGAEELNEFQENFVALCTKYKSHIPDKIQQFLNSFTGLEKDLAGHSELNNVQRFYKKRAPNIDDLLASVIEESKKHVPTLTSDSDIYSQLKAVRSKATKHLFSKSIILPEYSVSEQQIITDDEKFFSTVISGSFPNEYIALLKLSSIQHIINHEKFISLGLPLLESSNEQCPFCFQEISKSQQETIHYEHEKLLAEINKQNALKNQQQRVTKTLVELLTQVDKYHRRHLTKVNNFIKSDDVSSLASLEKLLPKEVYKSLHQAIISINLLAEDLIQAYNNVIDAHTKTINSINSSSQDPKILIQLTDALIDYIATARKYADKINTQVEITRNANLVLKKELDKQAGTEVISVLIEILERKSDIQKKFIIESILDSLSDFRSQVNEYVSDKLSDAVEAGLTSNVMKWYDLIKTGSDPDVHFSGFELPKTKTGTTKARQIGVRASSYGTELVSAISSLSESKLNALGFCINIANSLESSSPFEFLVIDDPVQSLDADHETQITTVIRKLAEEEGKQIFLFSHDREWLRKARKSCRTMNGYYYEIANYKISGPDIQARSWATVDERRAEILARINKSDVSEIDRQHAAEEFRLLFNDLAANIWSAKTNKSEGNVANYSNKKVRDILIQCGMDSPHVDQIIAAYVDLEDSHHKQAYTVSSDKLHQYLKLADFMKSFHEKLTVDKKLTKATANIEAAT